MAAVPSAPSLCSLPDDCLILIMTTLSDDTKEHARLTVLSKRFLSLLKSGRSWRRIDGEGIPGRVVSRLVQRAGRALRELRVSWGPTICYPSGLSSEQELQLTAHHPGKWFSMQRMDKLQFELARFPKAQLCLRLRTGEQPSVGDWDAVSQLCSRLRVDSFTSDCRLAAVISTVEELMGPSTFPRTIDCDLRVCHDEDPETLVSIGMNPMIRKLKLRTTNHASRDVMLLAFRRLCQEYGEVNSYALEELTIHGINLEMPFGIVWLAERYNLKSVTLIPLGSDDDVVRCGLGCLASALVELPLLETLIIDDAYAQDEERMREADARLFAELLRSCTTLRTVTLPWIVGEKCLTILLAALSSDDVQLNSLCVSFSDVVHERVHGFDARVGKVVELIIRANLTHLTLVKCGHWRPAVVEEICTAIRQAPSQLEDVVLETKDWDAMLGMGDRDITWMEAAEVEMRAKRHNKKHRIQLHVPAVHFEKTGAFD